MKPQQEQPGFPFRELDTAAVEYVRVPRNRKALFLAVDAESLQDAVSGEAGFHALGPNETSLFQLLLYLTYCCKGQVFQVTLENTDVESTSCPIREDYAHGRLFCFVLDMDSEISGRLAPSESRAGPRARYGQTSRLGDYEDASVFASEASERSVSYGGGGGYEDEDEDEDGEDGALVGASNATVTDEAFYAFMRLQLARQKVASLNNAMAAMRDTKGELSAVFEWLDIVTDTLHAGKIDRKKVRELQGSMYTPASQSGKQAVTLPEAIANMSLKAVAEAIERTVDVRGLGAGEELFRGLVSKLTSKRWKKHKVMRKYKRYMEKDVRFVKALGSFARALDDSGGDEEVAVGDLIVFKYTLEKLIVRDSPDLFAAFALHRHVSIAEARMRRTLDAISTSRRTEALAEVLRRGDCRCPGTACERACRTAYACFYNASARHPLFVSKHDPKEYFAHLYPHLAKVARLSKDMKADSASPKRFESITNTTFDILVTQGSSDQRSLYAGLLELMDDAMNPSCLSLGRALEDIHERLYLDPPANGDEDCAGEDVRDMCPVKVYDHALVRYMFVDTLQVGRLFQASTTFNYIVSNTAPRYTVERVMLFNIMGPGEGKTYANNVLQWQFKGVEGCIETLTSFTPQAFKYKQQRKACVVMIDDAHITHEKNLKALDRESNVIPNTFKNLLDTSVLESDVVCRDAASGKVDTVKCEAVHNCGFVWNTNTLGFVSDAWADRCVIMESEFPKDVTRTRSSKQLENAVSARRMDKVASVCTYRQNLVQAATMIAESEIMQFGSRFDSARDACVAALCASHVMPEVTSKRLPFCINQLVFAEAMKLACHFVFDLWIPPWTEAPRDNDDASSSSSNVKEFMARLNGNRLAALDEMSFGQICLEVNAVYKLCCAACLPDVCPRLLDAQGRFACKALGYVLGQVHEQKLKTCVKDGELRVSGLEDLHFPKSEFRGGSATAHVMLQQCSHCNFPTRSGGSPGNPKTTRLYSHKCAPNRGSSSHVRPGRGQTQPKRVTSLSISLEAVYDMLALYEPEEHRGFWEQVGDAISDAYAKGEFETVNAFGHSCQAADGARGGGGGDDDDDDDDDGSSPSPRVNFYLDFSGSPVRSLILEATAGFSPLDELTFAKCSVGEEVFRCSAPVYYGGVLARQSEDEAFFNAKHVEEASRGPAGTFHGPRVRVYSEAYAGAPVTNMSSFCSTRTTYHQDRLLLRTDELSNSPAAAAWQLEADWEWLDACDVLNKVHARDDFTPEILKRDYAIAMTAVKGEPWDRPVRKSRRLRKAMALLRSSDGRSARAMRGVAEPAAEARVERPSSKRQGSSEQRSSPRYKRTRRC